MMRISRKRLAVAGVLCLALAAALALTVGKPLTRRVLARLTPAPEEVVVTGTTYRVEGRDYLAWLPEQPKGAPVLLAMHGAARGAERFADATGLAQAGVARGYAVVAPLGTARREGGMRNWNAGHCCAYAFLERLDEAGFMDAVVEDAVERFGVDGGQVYVAGFSSGGMTGLRYALTRRNRVAAVASVSGTPDPALMPPAFPVPLLLIHGTEDEVMHFTGGFVADEEVGPGGGYLVLGAEEVAADWAAAMGAKGPQDSRINTRWNFAEVTERDWFSGDRPAVRLMVVNGGKHAWPGGREAPGADISATDEVFRFFAERGGPAAPTK